MAPCARPSTAVLPSWVPISCSISSPTISCASPSSSPLEAGVCPKTQIAPKSRGKSNKTTRTASIFNVFQQTASVVFRSQNCRQRAAPENVPHEMEARPENPDDAQRDKESPGRAGATYSSVLNNAQDAEGWPFSRTDRGAQLAGN